MAWQDQIKASLSTLERAVVEIQSEGNLLRNHIADVERDKQNHHNEINKKIAMNNTLLGSSDLDGAGRAVITKQNLDLQSKKSDVDQEASRSRDDLEKQIRENEDNFRFVQQAISDLRRLTM